jgi:cation/acetate symporter
VTLTIGFAVLAVLAIYAKAGAVALQRPISDFCVAGALVPAVLNGMAIAASLIAVLAFAGLAGAFTQGSEGLIALLIGGAGGLVLIAFLLAPYLRKFGGYTIPDFLGERFGGTALRPLAVLAVILCSFPALVLALLGVALIAMKVFAVGAWTGFALSVAMLLFCTFAGGMRSATLSQVAQYVVLLAASLGALVLLLWQQGTWVPELGAGLLDEAAAQLRLKTFAAEDPANRLALVVCLMTGTASLPHLLMRGFTARSVKEARTSFLLALPFAAVLCVAAPAYVGLFGQAPTESSDIPALVSFGLIAIGGISALLALGSGLVLAIANALSYDIYYKILHLTAPTERRLFIARMAIVLVAGLAAIVAFIRPEAMLTLAGAAFSFAASAFLPALVLGIWWKRATGEGALAGMLTGLGLCLYYLLAPRYLPFGFYETSSFLSNATPEQAATYAAQGQTYYLTDPGARDAALAAWEETARAVANWWGVNRDFAALFAVPVGFLVSIAVSLFTAAPSHDVQRFVEELRKPAAT